jgi:hypothetical protein
LSCASDLGADMIVAGAYHHSPLHESLLGGVSRDDGTGADVALRSAGAWVDLRAAGAAGPNALYYVVDEMRSRALPATI